MALVLDASVALAAALKDENEADRDYAHRALRSLIGTDGFAPSLWRLEVANSLLVAERRGRVSRVDSSLVFDDLLQLRLGFDDGEDDTVITTTIHLARRHGLTVYDAAYVELALRRSAALASLDKAMLRAAASEGVALFA
jgi:predicted nucleic acid-binding protein